MEFYIPGISKEGQEELCVVSKPDFNILAHPAEILNQTGGGQGADRGNKRVDLGEKVTLYVIFDLDQEKITDVSTDLNELISIAADRSIQEEDRQNEEMTVDEILEQRKEILSTVHECYPSILYQFTIREPTYIVIDRDTGKLLGSSTDYHEYVDDDRDVVVTLLDPASV